MNALWSSRAAVYLVTIGAAVGLGSVWRFPYLVGTGGGFAFVVAFIIACLLVASPLLIAELAIGRWSRRNPVQAAGTIASAHDGSRAWDAIGWLGTLAAFLIISYYTMIAGWVLAYMWQCLSGELVGLSHASAAARFEPFAADSLKVSAWHGAFVALVALISAGGLRRGIELANRIRAPALLLLMLALAGYACVVGDVQRGLSFAFAPDFAKLTPQAWLSAVGQAFYATGVGMAMMIAYGSYTPNGVSLARTALAITASIVAVSLLATVVIFPLVFRYGMDPAQGPQLVFEVLPAVFAEMPGGRLVGTMFFLLLAFAALTPSVAGLEPVIAWLHQHHRLDRRVAAGVAAAGAWLLGQMSVLSFGAWSNWHPLASLPILGEMNLFEAIDFVSANVLLPVGALLTCAFLGGQFGKLAPADAIGPMSPRVQRVVLLALRFVCPIAITTVLLAGLS